MVEVTVLLVVPPTKNRRRFSQGDSPLQSYAGLHSLGLTKNSNSRSVNIHERAYSEAWNQSNKENKTTTNDNFTKISLHNLNIKIDIIRPILVTL